MPIVKLSGVVDYPLRLSYGKVTNICKYLSTADVQDGDCPFDGKRMKQRDDNSAINDANVQSSKWQVP